MSLKIGIVGLPNVGKSTLFQALTKKQVDTSNYPFATIEPNVGIVAVEDERLGHLERLMKSARAIPAVVEFVDIAGLVRGASTGEGLGNQFLSHIREVDAIVEVVRSFEDENITHMEAGIDPERDRLIIETELFMADLATAEKALERASKNVKTGSSEAKERLESAKIIVEHLKKGKHIPREYLPYARELSLLSVKPMLYLYNTREENFVPKTPNSLALNIKLEEELSRMSEAEVRELEL
ncbi:MAG: redox-regulated ATPase YchF, partial [Candidatus Ryanbacteria bacterium]|nr:redox-regulated ATPase YchF [Candidatus Ryanbacteria bacterium]